MFQCSSASRKFLNTTTREVQKITLLVSVLFSEPKIPQSLMSASKSPTSAFQCSSASRKFLNCIVGRNLDREITFQCSSASRKFLNPNTRRCTHPRSRVSVLFSEPKIPQCTLIPSAAWISSVSVLFSEPKIPQSIWRAHWRRLTMVSVLFSEPKIPQCDAGDRCRAGPVRFQCSSASRKFLNSARSRNPDGV